MNFFAAFAFFAVKRVFSVESPILFARQIKCEHPLLPEIGK
jgi:hypothetical protein